jgi:BlaI family transcriptional regulator, penicillinase repressor
MKLTPAEWKLMNAVWQGHPVTARGIAARVQSAEAWAYTTIKTMLSRLVAKGALAERKEGKTSLYEPRLTRRAARAKALGALASDAFDGAFGALMHFIVEEENLSLAERRKLRDLLQEGRKKGAVKR